MPIVLLQFTCRFCSALIKKLKMNHIHFLFTFFYSIIIAHLKFPSSLLLMRRAVRDILAHYYFYIQVGAVTSNFCRSVLAGWILQNRTFTLKNIHLRLSNLIGRPRHMPRIFYTTPQQENPGDDIPRITWLAWVPT